MFLKFFSYLIYTEEKSELVSLDLTADGLGKLIAEDNDTGVLVRCGMLLDVGLNFLFQLLRGLCSLG